MTDRRRTGTRNELIRVATGLFRRRGVAAVGVGALCERAGVTKGVFSHHFPAGKDELLVAVVDRNGDDVVQRFAAASASGDGVRGLFDGYADLMRIKGLDFGCPVAAAVVDSSAGSAAARAAARVAFDRWRTTVRELVGSDADATLVIAALEGAILLARADGDPSTLERVGESLARLIVASSD